MQCGFFWRVFWAEQSEEPLDLVQGLRSYYLLGLDFSWARVWPTVPSIAFTSWTVLTCRHKHLKIFPSAQRRPSHHPIGSLVRPLRSSSCEAVASAAGLSDSARNSLVKLEGNMPVFPFRSPSHQPSSTWRRNKNHHFHRPLWGHLENSTQTDRDILVFNVLTPDLYCFNELRIFFGGGCCVHICCLSISPGRRTPPPPLPELSNKKLVYFPKHLGMWLVQFCMI